MLIKNINSQEKNSNGKVVEKEKTENCLFFDKFSKRLYSTNCNILLVIKSKNFEKFIELSQFEFFWLNKNQIKTKEEKCLNPVETSIIKNGIISYQGFIDVRDCITDTNNDKENDSNNSVSNLQKEKKNFLQFWKINEDDRIINLYNKKCLVVSKENKPIFSLWKKNVDENDKEKFNKYLNDFKINEIYLGDCYGNTKGYNGREIFILEEFKTQKLEFLALNKLINVYKKGANNLDGLISKSSNDMIKMIKINSNLIDNRQLIDSIENKLEDSQNNFDKFSSINDIETLYEKNGKLKKSENNFEIYGLALEKINIKGKII